MKVFLIGFPIHIFILSENLSKLALFKSVYNLFFSFVKIIFDFCLDNVIFIIISSLNKDENRFFKAFELILSQKKEYKAMLSVFGIKPSKSKYNSIL